MRTPISILALVAACGTSAPARAPAHAATSSAPATSPHSTPRARSSTPAEPAGPLLIQFEAGTSRFERGSEPGLERIKTYLDENPSVTGVRIESHFFYFEPEPGLALTAERAMVVARWLIDHGVDCKRLHPVGFGATGKPAPPPEDAAYVAVVAVEVDGRPVSGRSADGGGRSAGDPCH